MDVHFYCSFRNALGAMLLAGLFVAGQTVSATEQSPAPAPPVAGEADHESLRALVPLYEKAANEGKPELLKPYLDPEFTGIMVTGDEVEGVSSLEDYWAKIQKMLGNGGKYHVKVDVAKRSIISGDLAVAYGTTTDDVITGGDTYHFQGNWTAVCRKQNGQWKVLRVHGSMAPISNPFVAKAVRASLISGGVVGGIVGLLVGWVFHVLWSRRRKSPAA